jgi:blue copper oxidase
MVDDKQQPRLSRRRLLVLGAVSGGLVATGGIDALLRSSAMASKKGGGARNALYVPPEVGPSGTTLTAAPARIDLGGGHLSDALVYNGSLPGPTIRASRGQTASITLANRLARDDTTIHWHGMLVETAQDGQPHDAVAPGAQRTYSFPVAQRATFNWYHPHPHNLVSPQVAMGLAGGFVITDTDENALGLPSGKYEVPLVIRDAQLDSRGQLQYKPSSTGYLGSTPLVNGTTDATLDVDPAVYRLRVLNGAPARVFRLALDSGAAFRLIGNDGGLLEAPAGVTEVMLGPAERVDLLVDLRGRSVGDRIMLRCLDARWDLLELHVTGTAGGGSIPTGSLSSIPLLGDPVVTREFSFDGMSRINGQIYDLHRTDFQVPFGQTERWRFTTGGNAPHPVHVHGTHFQVVSRGGNRQRSSVLPWERGWKDTVLLQKGETVEVLIRFDAYRGRYLIHCHQLEHEDSGMMMNFVVV